MNNKKIITVLFLVLIPLIAYATGRTRFWGQVATPVPTTLVPEGTTQTIDWDNSNIQILDLGSATGDVTLTFSNSYSGAVYVIKIIQGATARTLVWPSNCYWAGGEEITLSTGEDEVDIVSCLYDGTNFYCNGVNNYY